MLMMQDILHAEGPQALSDGYILPNEVLQG